MKSAQDNLPELIEELKKVQGDWEFDSIIAKSYLPADTEVGDFGAGAEELEYDCSEDDYAAMTEIFSNTLLLDADDFASSSVLQALIADANSVLKNMSFKGGSHVKIYFKGHPDHEFKTSNLKFQIKNLRLVGNKIHFEFEFPDSISIY